LYLSVIHEKKIEEDAVTKICAWELNFNCKLRTFSYTDSLQLIFSPCTHEETYKIYYEIISWGVCFIY